MLMENPKLKSFKTKTKEQILRKIIKDNPKENLENKFLREMFKGNI